MAGATKMIQRGRSVLSSAAGNDEGSNEQHNYELEEEYSQSGQLLQDLLLNELKLDNESSSSHDDDCNEASDFKSNQQTQDDDNSNVVDQKKKDKKAQRKEAKKAMKAEKRAKREGTVAGHGTKECDVCQASVNLLVRCRIDETLQWKMVCGKCWKSVSGGVVDGDAAHPYYQYGGLWKNRAKR